ncbi:MAG: hypothetical protein ACLFOY_11815 [Desulfatibacillaceae bacterium]
MSDERNNRRPYEKPRLRVIELAAEEVLAVGCKLPPPGGRGFGNPAPSCLEPRRCFARGS